MAGSFGEKHIIVLVEKLLLQEIWRIKEKMESLAMVRFADRLYEYMDNYFMFLNGIIYKPNVTYNFPNKGYIAEHWRKIHLEIMTCGAICEYSDELKEVAKQYLSLFLVKILSLRMENVWKYKKCFS